MRIWFFTLLACTMLSSSFAFGADRSAQWRDVDDAVKQGLPKTAIEKLEPIIQAAIQEKAWGEAVKAVARKIALEGTIQGNKPEEKITRLEAELTTAPPEMQPLLQTILAEWYWEYFLRNRWRFMQRTQTGESPGADFTTWDLPRLFAEIDRQFQKALASADTLKQTPIGEFDDVLEKGTYPDKYRPTLYDFIAQEALKFYTSGEQAAAKPEEAFEISAESPIFDSVQEFLGWEPQTTDVDSPKLKAIRLYQDLLRFHQDDTDKTALLDVDLGRLVFGSNVAFGENKDVRYKAALQAFVNQWADNEVSAMALYQWARVLQREDNLVEARNMAQRAVQTYPDSFGGRLCRNLVAEIESRSVTVSVERIWNAPWPKIQVRYQNITNVYFRAVAYDWDTFLDRRHNRPENLNENEKRALLSKTPAREWSVSLPVTSDYQEHDFETPAPETLKPGFYFIIASSKPDFSGDDNQMVFTDVWVSDLGLVVRTHPGAIEGFVLEADSGQPLEGADVAYWYLDNRGNRVAGQPVKTDEDGEFRIATVTQGRGYLLRVRHDDQELASAQEYWTYNRGQAHPYDQTVFFTDRGIYRPGQTIQYKGICLHVDQQENNYHVLAGQRATVIFADANNKEIARQEVRCNDYGSFAGSFTAPRNRLTGAMRIYVSEGPNGQANFSVEEYKRPKFQVTLEAPKTAAKLNEKVSLQGKAESYTGAAVDGAQVKYRVVREVRWPIWWGWYHWRQPQGNASQEIAHGTATTETDGTFEIEFTARPDPKTSEQDGVSFRFDVYADVTDSAGETRSAQRTINVGFQALEATISLEAWQSDDKPVELRLSTTTLDGEPQVAEGSLKIYRLKAPATVQRTSLGNNYLPYRSASATNAAPDLSNPHNWELGELVQETGFTTDTNGQAKVTAKLAEGEYHTVLETQDRFGKKVTALASIQVLNPDATKLGIKIPNLLEAPKWSLEPGEEFMAVWGTGYETGRAYVEIEHRQQIIQHYWTPAGQTQHQIKLPVTEAMRGGFTVHVVYVRQNRAYLESRRVEVPWSNKDLEISWEHFVSKLGPNEKETWTAVVKKRSDGETENRNSANNNTPTLQPSNSPEHTVAEMVATLYDQSLDQFRPNAWPERFSFFYQDYSSINATFENRDMHFQWLLGRWERNYENVVLKYREFPPDLVGNVWGGPSPVYALGAVTEGGIRTAAVASRMPTLAPAAAPAYKAPATGVPMRQSAYFAADRLKAAREEPPGGPPSQPPIPDLSQVVARKDLNETAFFFPQLLSDSNGIVRMTFTMPEALTTWRFMAFAHDKELRSGYLEAKATTSKDLMVQPNPPRFVREGDELEFTVKVMNQSTNRQSGKVRLNFSSALNEEAEDQLLGNTRPDQNFEIPPKESRSLSWHISIPDGAPFLTYKAVAATATLSDGEEGYLPVLSRRVLVTESLPLPIRGPATNHFKFTKLLDSGGSPTIRNQSVTVQMVSNPAWYAVLALPYLMEFPYECTEQTFNRFYANALARNIADSSPRIRRIFDLLKATPALDSPLEKNQDLKSVMIEETPWLRQAESESQARRNVGVLFDDNRLNNETTQTLQKLADMQLDDGAWPWFPGGRGNDYITLYITCGFGRLRHLGVDVPVDPAIRALDRLDHWMQDNYERIMKQSDPEAYVPSPTDALYLYTRSFFLKDKPIPSQYQKAIQFFLERARQHWLKTGDRQSQGHIALALYRFNAFNSVTDSTPQDIMRSLKERSVTNEEMGMFWRDTEASWWWYRAPIETQALMIEAFDEITHDEQAVDECRVWLLKQKQTQDWKTTKATADAVYALLLRGKDILSSDKLVEVVTGGEDITPRVGSASGQIRNPQSAIRNQPEPGTGFYEHRFVGSEIRPELGNITVRKLDSGVAWGGIYWQYLEDLSKVTPHEGTPLKLKKTLFTKINTKNGPTLEPVKGPLHVGDELVVRIELRTDRDMEYVHLKDQRGSGTEPVNVLSQYKYQDGLAYYESTRDTASHFYIDYLPKGTYVFEYSVRVQLRGEYQDGIASVQCMYAPEFNSHSASQLLTVR